MRLCRGDRRKAEQLILDELHRSPGSSRQGAALAIVTRIRHERTGYPRPL